MLKVTLGEWPHAPNVMLHPTPFQASAPLLLPGPHGNPRITADIEMPSFIAATTHHGLQVEMLSPQLADYFGVPRRPGSTGAVGRKRQSCRGRRSEGG